MTRTASVPLLAFCLLLAGCTGTPERRDEPTGLQAYALEPGEVPSDWRLLDAAELAQPPLSDWFHQGTNPETLEARPWMGGLTMAGWLQPGDNTTLYSAVYEAAGRSPSLVVYQATNRTGSSDAAAISSVFCDPSAPGIQMLASDDVLVTLWAGDADVQDDAYVAQLRAVAKSVADRTGATHVCDAGTLLDDSSGRALDFGGDGPEDAEPMQPGTWERGLYLEPGEEDWFRIDPDQNGTWGIDVHAYTDIPITVEVLDRNTSVADATGDGSAEVEFWAEPASYYVVISSPDAAAEGSYWIGLY